MTAPLLAPSFTCLDSTQLCHNPPPPAPLPPPIARPTDFKNTDNMLKILTNSGTASSISELRALAGTSMRGAIAHTGTASRAVAKERGFIAGRRFLRARVRIEQESCELRSCELDSNSSRSPVSLSLVTAVYEIV